MKGHVMINLDPPKMVPPGPNISKYMDPPELIFQKYAEIFGPPLKYKDPPLNCTIETNIDNLSTDSMIQIR